LQQDERAELSNTLLGKWSTGYLANMAALARSKEQNKSITQAKKNAAFWVLGQGIGRVEVTFGADIFPHPLEVFSGHNLLELLQGEQNVPSRSKRSRSQSADIREEQDEEEARRVRRRTDDEYGVARGEEERLTGLDDEGILIQGDDYNPESEVGRHAPSSLREQSSAMPWNLSSRAGSVQRLGSAGGGLSSSVGGAGGFPAGPPSILSRRGSRMTSASPLIGKAPTLPSLAIEDDLTGTPLDEGLYPDHEDFTSGGGANDLDDFDLYGPSAAVDTQTAAQSQWVQAALENEAVNFLNFLRTQIWERGVEEAEEVRGELNAEEEAGDENRQQTKSITFEQLLSPTENTKVVAAQALLHVLSLKTKGLIEVEQEADFDEIRLRIVPGKNGNVGSVEGEVMPVES
jgi:hypothetical protein